MALRYNPVTAQDFASLVSFTDEKSFNLSTGESEKLAKNITDQRLEEPGIRI